MVLSADGSQTRSVTYVRLFNTDTIEVFLQNRWCLLDAGGPILFDPYDPNEKLLPGGKVERFAYDKGDDPRQLVLSLDWSAWTQETIDYFSNFDVGLLDTARPATTSPGRRLG